MPERETPPATPEGVAVGVALAQLSYLYFLTQAGVSLAIHEGLIHLKPEVMGEVAAVAFGLSLIGGYLYERETLELTGLSAYPLTTFLHLRLHNPALATFLGDAIGQLNFFVNPVDVGSTLGGEHLFYSNLISRSVLGLGYSVGLNWAIRQGLAKPLTDKINSYREKLTDTLNELELKHFPLPERVYYPYETSGDFPSWQPDFPLST